MNDFGRIANCGAISGYNDNEEKGKKFNTCTILFKHIKFENG